jgi:dGTPase
LKFNEALKRVLDHLATDLIESTRRAAVASGVQTVEDVRRCSTRLARFSPEARAQNDELKTFLFRRVYSHPAIAEERERSVGAIDALFRFFVEHPGRMPAYYAEQAQREPGHRVVCDYIAGMTDHFLLRQGHEFLGTPAAPAV